MPMGPEGPVVLGAPVVGVGEGLGRAQLVQVAPLHQGGMGLQGRTRGGERECL